ncbi:UNVERIFIED_CONTAM: hypothetical protein HDU68_000007 [Siphonaria sp. JEL0065]|nr:hypothetical protein HDU68_000007 [Siphonaria sp. JEL0065]
MTLSSPTQSYQTASEFWAASDALRGLASVAVSRDDDESSTPPSATAASPTLSPTTTTTTRMPRGPGGINLMDDDSETNQLYETSFMNSEMNGLITPIYLPQRQPSRLPSVFSRPSIMIVTPDTRITQSQQHPVLLSHSYQTQQDALRHQELRFRMQEGYRHFQPLHSPIMVHAVPPPPPPPYLTRPPMVNPVVSVQSPFGGPQVCSVPLKTHQPQQQAPMYHTPMRATLRGFKRPKQMYKCTWDGCTKEFAKPSLLKSHINIHQSIKPFECKHCTQAFARNHDLRRHERCVHSIGGKEAQCRGCKKMFTRVDSCRFHEKTCHFVTGDVPAAGSGQQVLDV